jgi:hypothetical protein
MTTRPPVPQMLASLGMTHAQFVAARPKPTATESDDRKICVVCLDKPKCMLFLPCKHLAVCQDCAGRVRDCPVCRTRVQNTIHIYDS